MRRSHVLLTAAVMAGVAALAVAPAPARAARQPSTEVITVRCRGSNGPVIDKESVTIALGDDVLWRSSGSSIADSLEISPKNDNARWPFSGNPSRGGASARARGANRKTTYSYNIAVMCRVGNDAQWFTIDPDIIID